MAKLQVYVSNDCWTCDETDRIVSKVNVQFPKVEVEVVDLQSGRWPSTVFASPTYMLDGRIVSLGNPDWEQLSQRLLAVQDPAREGQ